MFTLSLILADANNIELSLAEEKFEELFGSSNKIELPLETEEEIQYVEDAIFELVSIMSLGIDTSFLLITDNENLRSRKLDDYDDLRFFIEESKSFNALQGNSFSRPFQHQEVPLRGNYWDIGDDYYFTKAETFASPNDIFDLHDFTYSVPQTLSKVNPDVIDTADQAALENPVVPRSFGDRRGINQRTALDDAKDLIAKDRLAALGASFPYMNEEQLLQDFDKLSRMDEIDDSDLINLLRFGYDEMKNLASKATEPVKKVGEWGLGKVGGALKKAFASKEDKMNKRAANAEAEKRALDAEKELAKTKKDKAEGDENADQGDNASQSSQSSQDAEAAYVADNLSNDAKSRLDNLQRAESKVETLETKAEKGADKVEGLKTRLENEKDPDKKAEIEDSIKQQEEKNKEIADKTTAAKEDLTKAADGAKAAEKEVENLKQEAAEKVADKNIEKTKDSKESKESKDSKDSTEGDKGEGGKTKEDEKSDETKEKEKAERIKNKMDQVKQELKSAKYKSDDGVKKARTIAAGLRNTDPKAYAQVKADISKYVDKLEAKPRESVASARG